MFVICLMIVLAWQFSGVVKLGASKFMAQYHIQMNSRSMELDCDLSSSYKRGETDPLYVEMHVM
jgi:hypothetical protein